MNKINRASAPTAPLDQTQHGDMAPPATPPGEIVNETIRSVAGAFDVHNPSPTPGYYAPKRGEKR